MYKYILILSNMKGTPQGARCKDMAKAKYTYYYNGKVVRNSNRLYKYGLVNQYDEVIACSSTSQGALKDKSYYLNLHKRNLAYYEKNNLTQEIEWTKNAIANTEKWHVVELEVKEN